jgi:hypothetical protein
MVLPTAPSRCMTEFPRKLLFPAMPHQQTCISTRWNFQTRSPAIENVSSRYTETTPERWLAPLPLQISVSHNMGIDMAVYAFNSYGTFTSNPIRQSLHYQPKIKPKRRLSKLGSALVKEVYRMHHKSGVQLSQHPEKETFQGQLQATQSNVYCLRHTRAGTVFTAPKHF